MKKTFAVAAIASLFATASAGATVDGPSISSDPVVQPSLSFRPTDFACSAVIGVQYGAPTRRTPSTPGTEYWRGPANASGQFLCEPYVSTQAGDFGDYWIDTGVTGGAYDRLMAGSSLALSGWVEDRDGYWFEPDPFGSGGKVSDLLIDEFRMDQTATASKLTVRAHSAAGDPKPRTVTVTGVLHTQAPGNGGTGIENYAGSVAMHYDY